MQSNGPDTTLTAVTPLGVVITFDPNKKFQQIDPRYFVDCLGILPFWINPNDERPMKEQFDAKYQFGVFEMKGGKVKDDGSYKYPGDPLLHPVAKASLRNETIFFYQHAMVCIRNETTKATFMTRLD
jgi:hypothetical protein